MGDALDQSELEPGSRSLDGDSGKKAGRAGGRDKSDDCPERYADEGGPLQPAPVCKLDDVVRQIVNRKPAPKGESIPLTTRFQHNHVVCASQSSRDGFKQVDPSRQTWAHEDWRSRSPLSEVG
jgi:hypothetical protein